MVAKSTFAFIFIIFAGISLVIPNFPPAQLVFAYLKIPQTVLIWRISIATLINGIITGSFWVIIAAIIYGIANYRRELKPLAPIPFASHLATPQLENPLVDYRVNRMPPALTIPPSFNSRKSAYTIQYRQIGKVRNKPSWKHEIIRVKGHSQNRYRDLRTGRFIKKPWLV